MLRAHASFITSGVQCGVNEENAMKHNIPQLPNTSPKKQEGAIGYIFLWLIGVPIPLLFVFFLLRGCT